MALNPTTLGAAIKAALCANPDPETGIDPVSLAVDNDQLDAFCSRLASAVVEHIVANAVVTGTIMGVSAPDVSGGAVTGSCSGTIS